MSDRLKLLVAISGVVFLFLVLSFIFPFYSVSFTLAALILLAYDIYFLILLLVDASFDWYSVPVYLLSAVTGGLAPNIKPVSLGLYLVTGCFVVLVLYYWISNPDQIKPK